MLRSVFHYGDYRTFLSDYHGSRKRKPGWSLSVWARHVGVKSPSTLQMILKGDRHPGPELTDSLCAYFRFSPEEADYFSNLVRLGKSSNDVRLSVLLMEQLSKTSQRGEFIRLTHEKFTTISHWYYYALRELVRLPAFRENATWLSQKFHFAVSPKQIKDALRTLLKLGLLERGPTGRLRATSAHVTTPSDFAAEGLKRFHEETLENVKASLRQIPTDRREIQGTTLAVSRKDLEKAKRLIRRFQDEFCDAVERPDGDAVFHLEIAFIPLVTLAKGDVHA